ncbi:hypothetical protein OROHE_024333 [Orobanche hederae]
MAEFDDEDNTDMEIISDSEEWCLVEKKKRNCSNEIVSSSISPSDSTNHVSVKKIVEKTIRLSLRRNEGMEIKDVVKENALRFLPAKVLTRFSTVSKNWEHWINSPFLAYQQSYSFLDISGFFCQSYNTIPRFLSLDHAVYGVPAPSLSFLPVDVDIIGSTHGLLVCQACTGTVNSYYICNPANKDFKELPKPGYYHGLDSACVLAFDPCLLNMGAHYHLVCAVPLVGQPTVMFEIYSSETESWRCSDAVCVELDRFEFTGSGLYMKGVAFWRTSTNKVLAFDLKNEVYGILSLPEEIPPIGVLAEIKGELCYLCMWRTDMNKYVVDIYCGAELRFGRRIDVKSETMAAGIGGYYGILPWVFEGGEMVMMIVGDIMYACSLRDGRIEKVGSCGQIQFSCSTRVLPYVNSLVYVA